MPVLFARHASDKLLLKNHEVSVNSLFRIHSGKATVGRKRVAMVITDGVSRDSVREPARRLKASDCEVFALGIGRGYRISQLRQIATDSRHVFTVSFGSLGRIIKQIKTKVCQRISSKCCFLTAIYLNGPLLSLVCCNRTTGSCHVTSSPPC